MKLDGNKTYIALAATAATAIASLCGVVVPYQVWFILASAVFAAHRSAAKKRE